jgi:hypothetical protein
MVSVFLSHFIPAFPRIGVWTAQRTGRRGLGLGGPVPDLAKLLIGMGGPVPDLAKLLIGIEMTLLAKAPDGFSADFGCRFFDLSIKADW